MWTQLAVAKQELLAFENGVKDLREKLTAAQAMNADLLVLLHASNQEKDAYGSQVQQLASTVGMLDKLTKTDKELLQKYSSVYFLNENYVPSNLSSIDSTFVYREGTDTLIHSGVKSHLEALLKAAAVDNMPLKVLSAYRSFGTQATLKTAYKMTYGAGTANAFSADQGYSEHQLGSAADFTTVQTGENLGRFERSGGYAWLLAHAHEYGFSISYPKGNAYFQFEPWHWRYIGVALATKLHDEHTYFYDLDQREINQYLVKIFD